MKLVIYRTRRTEMQTIGIAFLVDEFGLLTKTFASLELPWVDNNRRVSCIPCGSYTLRKRVSHKFGNHWEVLAVPNRSNILIHKGNFYTQTSGCILLGTSHAFLNNDNSIDVINSKWAVDHIFNIAPVEITLEITAIW